MELVRTEVIPYQWNALNDNVPGAAPSFCMRNYRRAGEVEKSGKQKETNLFRSNTRWILLRHCRRMAKWTEDFMASCSRIPILPNGWRQLRTPDTASRSGAGKTADEAIEAVCAAQREDGYLDTYYLINDQDMILQTLRTTMSCTASVI